MRMKYFVHATKSRIIKLAISFALCLGFSTLSGVTSSRAVPFEIYESMQYRYIDACGCTAWEGLYTLVNNTTDLLVTGFEVTNPYAGVFYHGTVTAPSVFLSNWDSYATDTGYFHENAFVYFATSSAGYLGNGTYANFIWGPQIVFTSAVMLTYTTESDPTIHTYLTEAIVTPLPAALPLMGSVLGVTGLLAWRRKRKAAAIAAA